MALNEKFGRSRSNVRKVQLQESPDLQFLQRLINDLSISATGAECDVVWQLNSHLYTLNLTRQAAQANWKLFRGQESQLRLVWQQTNNDMNAVYRDIQAELDTLSAAPPKPSTPRPSMEDQKSIGISNNLSGKLRHLFIGAQDSFAATASADSLSVPQSTLNSGMATEYVDLTAGREILKKIIANEQGVFSYPTFLFFLEREYYEAQENNTPITLIIFSAKDIAHRRRNPGTASWLLETVFVEVAKRLRQTQRRTDILARYEQDKFAVLLPDTNLAGGKAFIRRVEKALLRAETEAEDCKDGPVRCNFGIATLGQHCPTLPGLLAFAEKAFQSAQQLGSTMISDEDILAEQRLSGYEYLSKAIDLAPTEQLVAKLVSGGIFTYQAFLSFLEHEYYRSFRKKRELFVLILKLRVGAETFDKEENLLPQAVLDEVIKRVSALLAKRDIFAHYQHGNFIILRSNASAGQLENLSRRIIHAIMSDEWLTPECSTASLHSVTQICSVQPHPSLPELVALVPIKY